MQSFLITRMFFWPWRLKKKMLQRQLKAQEEELKEVKDKFHEHSSGRTTSLGVGNGNCRHKGHHNSALIPCSLKKCTEYTYCGIKERHPEYFSQLTWLKQFSTSSEYQFIKSLTLQMYQADELCKQSKVNERCMAATRVS